MLCTECLDGGVQGFFVCLKLPVALEGNADERSVIGLRNGIGGAETHAGEFSREGGVKPSEAAAVGQNDVDQAGVRWQRECLPFSQKRAPLMRLA